MKIISVGEYAQVVHCKLHFEHVAKMDYGWLLQYLPCWDDDVLEVTAVAVAGLEPLYRGVFSFIVAVSTVFCRLKFDWTLLFTLGAADGGGPEKSSKLVKNLSKTLKLPKATTITSCRVWILRTRGSPARFRRGCGYGALDSIMRCGTRSGIARIAVRGWLTGGPAGPGSTSSGCMRSSTSSGSVISSSWHVPQGERRSGSTTVAFDLKCIEIHYQLLSSPKS